MRLEDFDYYLPPELIAQTPAARRDESRLLVVHRESGGIEDRSFRDIVDFFSKGDLLVVNNARVLPARLFGKKAGGGAGVEILLLRPVDENTWEAMVKPAKRLRAGHEIILDGGERLLIKAESESGPAYRLLGFPSGDSAFAIMRRYGRVPIPPYIKSPGTLETQRYQTVYADRGHAVAAPTAGLHFTLPLLELLAAKGVERVGITLNVGPGTFLPLRDPVIERNVLHSEYFEVGGESAARIDSALKRGRRVIAVGTTSLRVLESLGPEGFGDGAVSDTTRLFLYPGVPIRVAGALLTNFHLPKTSLLCLVAAFAGTGLIRRAYRHAVENSYRFYSFGDAMLIID